MTAMDKYLEERGMVYDMKSYLDPRIQEYVRWKLHYADQAIEELKGVVRMATEALAKTVPMANEYVETNPCYGVGERAQDEKVMDDAQIALFHCKAWIESWETRATAHEGEKR